MLRTYQIYQCGHVKKSHTHVQENCVDNECERLCVALSQKYKVHLSMFIAQVV